MDGVMHCFTASEAGASGVVDRATLTRILRLLDHRLTEEQCRSLYDRAGGGAANGGALAIQDLCAFLEAEEKPSPPTNGKKPLFFDMKHSNNAARIRLWLKLKEGAQDLIDTKMLTYPELKSEEYAKINPLKKVPGLLRPDGVTVFESYVILEYLEDKHCDLKPAFKPGTPEERQKMEIMIRCHDLYVASPNCTAPGFSHCQGAMYLSYGWHGEARGMDLRTRAAKVAELWSQLSWLNGEIVGPYLVGEKVSLADFTWYPTTIFMEFMLPRVFGWPDVFRETEGPFPAVAKWWMFLTEQPAFKEVRAQIYEYWEEMEQKGQFKHIIDEVAADTTGLKFKYP